MRKKKVAAIPNPYPGPRPFEKADYHRFYGRESIVQDLYSKIVAHKAILLYSQSGAGKTSLLNAGLMPLLEEEGFEVFPTTRVSGDIPPNLNITEIENIFVFNALTRWIADGEVLNSLASLSMKQFLETKEHESGVDDFDKPRIIIFDQFEELFSSFEDQWQKRQGFFENIAEALEADPLLRVLFSIREDYLANIDPYAELMPERLRTRLRLERLSKNAACQAIEGPLADTGCKYDKGVAEKLADELMRINVVTINSSFIEASGEYIEPVQLQVVCQSLWNSLPKATKLVTADHLTSFGNVSDALKDFYESAVKATAKKARVKKARIRKWFGSELITKAKTRGTVFRDKETTGSLPNKAVNKLEDKHIIRAELRSGARWYELTHDRFIEPILQSNERFQHRFISKLNRFGVVILKTVIAFCVVGFIYATFQYFYMQQEKYRRTTGQLEFIKNLNSVERERVAGTIIESATHYLVQRKDSVDIFPFLIEASRYLPINYGLEAELNFKPDFVAEAKDWPLTLVTNPYNSINLKFLLYYWDSMTSFYAYSWGIPVPTTLKIEFEDALPPSELRIIRREDELNQGNRLLNNKDIIVKTNYQPDMILINQNKVPENLEQFFEKNKTKWSELTEIKYGGPWWLVPKWTHPLWKTVGVAASAPEAALFLSICSKLLDEPQLLLNEDCVKLLLKQTARQYPSTVQDALQVRGGLQGIRQDLIEVVKNDYPLVRLNYILASLTNYPDLTSDEAAIRAIEEQTYLGFPKVERLVGTRGKRKYNSLSQDTSGIVFPEIYNNSIPYLVSAETQIRVELGNTVSSLFINKNQKLLPELLEAIFELRQELYHKFGIIIPGVRFRNSDNIEADEVRIEVWNQTSGDYGAEPIKVAAEQPIQQFIKEMRLRLYQGRQWFIIPEYVEYRVKGTNDWLLNYYSLNDIKLMLRALIAPPDEEIDFYENSTDLEIFDQTIIENSILDHNWLLNSIAFWRHCKIDLLDLATITAKLKQTQNARFSPQKLTKSNKRIISFIKSGLWALETGNMNKADELFRKAISVNSTIAEEAFLKYYPAYSKFTGETAVKYLNKVTSLPAPGSIASGFYENDSELFDLEYIMNKADVTLNPQQKRTAFLFQFSYYVNKEYYKSAISLLNKFILTESVWSPDEKYILAYSIFNLARPGVEKPEYIELTDALFVSALNSFSQNKKADCFQELIKVCQDRYQNNPLGWQKLHQLALQQNEDFWIPLIVAEAFVNYRNTVIDITNALHLLDIAEANLPQKDKDRSREGQIWIDWYRALGYMNLAEYREVIGSSENREKALAGLKRLTKSLPENHPLKEGAFSKLFDVYMQENQIEMALDVIKNGLELLPDSESLLSSKFVVHLAKSELQEALEVGGEAADKTSALFNSTLVQFLMNHVNTEYSGRQFLNTSHEYGDYVRMILYSYIKAQGRSTDALKLLEDRWEEIDRSTWAVRLNHGNNRGVWREMWIGYYLGEVERNEIFEPLQNFETFSSHPFSRIGLAYSGLTCEAYFYEALLQGVSGDEYTRTQRKLENLEKVLESKHYNYLEYQMAKYLKNSIQEQLTMKQ